MNNFDKPIKAFLTEDELEFCEKFGLNKDTTMIDALDFYLAKIHELGYVDVRSIKDENKNKKDLIYYDILIKIYDNLPKY